MSNVPWPFHPDLVIACYVDAFEGTAFQHIMQRFDGRVMTRATFDQIEQTIAQWFQTCWSKTFSQAPLGTFTPSIDPTPQQLHAGEITAVIPKWFADLLKEAQDYNRKSR